MDCFSASATEADIDGGSHGDTRKTTVHLEELNQRLDSGTIKLIDVREPSEIEETGSIPTSINVPRITGTIYYSFCHKILCEAAVICGFIRHIYRVILWSSCIL